MTDILEQAREIAEAEIMRQYKAHPEWDEAKDVVENIDCKTITSAILALAEPKWREIDDEAKSGAPILVTVRVKKSPLLGRFDKDGNFLSIPGDYQYSPLRYLPVPMPILPPPAERGTEMSADGMHENGRPSSRARMRNLDAMPPEYRKLSHQYGYRVYRLWLNGWSVERIKACEKRDGTLSAKTFSKNAQERRRMSRASLPRPEGIS